MRTHLALAAVPLLLVVASCLPPRAPKLTGEVRVSELARRPERYVGRTVAARGRVRNAAELAEGIWLEVASEKRARGAAAARHAAAPDSASFLLPVGAAPGLAEDLRGREVELRLRIDGEVTLPDGRRALSALPIEIALPLEPAKPGTPAPEEVRAGTEKLARALRAAEAESFADPQLGPTHLGQPAVRYTFLDPGKKRPFWHLPGPASIEKEGDPGAPRYRFTSVVGADNGYHKESSCRFRVEDGRLRSVAYDEIVRDPGGKVVGERHLDFLSGKVMDKVSGKMFRWPKNIYAAPCIGFALMGYPFAEKRIVNFFMWSEYDPFTTMYAILDGTETVTVPAGTFDCYRIRMNANIEHMIRSLELPTQWAYDLARETARGMRNPDTVLWLMRESPHLFVKMTGVMGPPGTTRGVIEITALDESARAALAAGRRQLVRDIWAAPQRFAGRTVHLRFRIAASGESNGGRWLQAEPGEGSAGRPRFFVPSHVPLGARGDEVELRARVGGLMSLDTGGRAVVLEPAPRPGDPESPR